MCFVWLGVIQILRNKNKRVGGWGGLLADRAGDSVTQWVGWTDKLFDFGGTLFFDDPLNYSM